MKKVTLVTGIVFLLSAGCSSEDDSTVHSIFGEDDRVISDQYSELVGGIFFAREHICTAFVSGPNEITTAAHCFDDEQSLDQYSYDTLLGASYPIDGVSKFIPSADFISLNVQVGEQHLIEGQYSDQEESKIVSWDDSQAVISATGWTLANTVHPVNYGLIYHTLVTVSGSSGSPLIQNNRVVGVHLGYLEGSDVNFAIILSELHKIDLSSEILDNLTPEFKVKKPKIKIPNKIGGSVGHAIGQVTNPIKDAVKIPAPIGLTGTPYWGGGDCGSTWWESQVIPDHWGVPGQLANFQPACREHDACYAHQRGQEYCDNTFRGRLQSICRSSFRNDLFTPQRLECENVVASVYFKALKLGGKKAYDRCRNGRCL